MIGPSKIEFVSGSRAASRLNGGGHFFFKVWAEEIEGHSAF